MKKTLIACLVVIAMHVGCSTHDASVATAASGPLSLEEWRQMKVTDKYELETYERLKAGDPKLKDPGRWQSFMEKVIVPQRMIDIPTDYTASKQ